MRGGWANYIPECEDARDELMRKAGARKFGSGVHRAVYGFKKDGESCVVKIAKSDSEGALEANRNERDGWRAAPAAAKRYLMPVTQADSAGWWLVMPEAQTIDTEEDYAAPSPYQTRVREWRTRRVPGGGTLRILPGVPGVTTYPTGRGMTVGRSLRGDVTVRTTGSSHTTGRPGSTVYTTIYPEGDGGSQVGDEVSRNLSDAGVDCSDLHSANVGYYQGRAVAIDYGMGLKGGGTGQARCTIRPRAGRTRPRAPLTLGRFA